MPENYYVLLGISKGADQGKIKKAYRKAVKKHHPDVAPDKGSMKKFLAAKNAYETLSDEKSRQQYDRKLEHRPCRSSLSRPPEPLRNRSSRYREKNAFTAAVDDFSDNFLSGFFADFFQKERDKGKNLLLELILNPQEAAAGGLFPVTVPVITPCPKCQQAGIRKNFFCPCCNGNGQIRSERRFSINISPGIKHGTTVRLSLADLGLCQVILNIVVTISPDKTVLW